MNPTRIRVGTPRRARPQVPEFVEIVQQRLDPNEVTEYEGIASATVARALLDCRGLVMTERLMEAAHEGERRGLLTRAEATRVMAELESAA